MKYRPIKTNIHTRFVGMVLLALLWACGAVAADANTAIPRSNIESLKETKDPFWGDQERGWFWYEVMPEDLEEEPVEEAVAPPAPPKEEAAIEEKKDTRAPELVEMERVQKRLKDLREIAIINPTVENVRAYVHEQELAMERAHVFSETWQHVLTKYPELDYRLKGRPTNNIAAKVYDSARNADRDAVLKEVAKTHGLFFYIKGNCAYCHALGPILKSFEKSYGFNVIAITLDGGGVKDYPAPVKDNGSAIRFNVETTPALVLVNPTTNDSTPIGYGMMSYEDIRERVYFAVRMKPGTRFSINDVNIPTTYK